MLNEIQFLNFYLFCKDVCSLIVIPKPNLLR
jgi:hypothetical protein